MKDIKIISELPDETIGYHLKQARRNLARSGIRLTDFHGAEVWLTDSAEINYLCLIKDTVILFLIRLVKRRELADGQQIMLIPNAPREFVPLVQRFSMFALFKMLLPKYHILLQDKEQPASGAKMYRGLVANGMGSHCIAYIYDTRVTPGKWIYLSYSRSVQDLNLGLYGPRVGNEKLLLAISDKKILKDKPATEAL